MKQLGYVLNWVAIIAMTPATLALLNCNYFVKTDIQLVQSMFLGMSLACIGFYFQERGTVPMSRFQRENRRKCMRNMLLGFIMCFGVVILTLFVKQ
jgi:hypothetical protein